MRWVFDRDIGQLVQERGTRDLLWEVGFKSGDRPLLEVEFVRGVEDAPLGKAPVEFVFAGKLASNVGDEAPLVWANAWTLDAATGRWKSRMAMSEAMAALLVANETVDLVGELTFTDEDDFPQTSQTLTVMMRRDVWKGTETTPLVLPTPLEWLVENLPVAWALNALTVAWGSVTGKPSAFPPVIGGGAGDAVAGNDSRLTNSREWTAETVGQAEAETGAATTRRAWTAQRVRQAVEAWWATVSDNYAEASHNHSGVYDPAGAAQDVQDSLTLVQQSFGSYISGHESDSAAHAAAFEAHKEEADAHGDRAYADGLISGLTALQVATILGASSYASLAEANAALSIGRIYFNTTSNTLEITTA